MNFRFVTCLFAMMGVLASRTRADVAAVPSDVPINSAAASALDPTPFADEISQKVTAEVQKLVDKASDAATVNMVRTWLVSQDPQGASAGFQGAYTNALNQAFLTVLAQPDPPLVARMNMGIVIKNLPGGKDNLAATIIKLLNDKSPAVLLWGARAAESLLPAALSARNANAPFNNVGNGGQRDALLAAIANIIVNHPDGTLAWEIADAGYRAVNPHTWNLNLDLAPASWDALIATNLKLEDSRIVYYQNTGVPTNPQADTYPSYLLMSEVAWGKLTVIDQGRAVENALDLTALMAQRAAMAKNPNSDLINAMQALGKWIQVLGQILQDQTIQQAGAPLIALRPDMPSSQIKAASDGAYQAFLQNSAFQTLPAPKTIAGATSASDATGATGATATSLAPQ